MDEPYATIERFTVKTRVKPRTLSGQRLATCPRNTKSTGHASVLDPPEDGCDYGDQVTVRDDTGIETEGLKAER